jgi:Sec-independent protein translocase protein TatA
VDLLSPAKLLVILVVALAVLGPDKLPTLAKQAGNLWRDFSRFRQKLESDVRGSFLDLPSTETATKAIRAPLSFLDSLADAPPTTEGRVAEAPGTPDVVTPEAEFRDSGSHWPTETVTASETEARGYRPWSASRPASCTKYVPTVEDPFPTPDRTELPCR